MTALRLEFKVEALIDEFFARLSEITTPVNLLDVKTFLTDRFGSTAADLYQTWWDDDSTGGVE